MIKKSTFIFVSISLLFALNINAQKQIFQFSNNWGDEGYSIVNQNNSKIEVVYSIHKLTLHDSDIDGTLQKNIAIPGVFLFNDAGMPDLPGNGKFIAIPQGAEANLVVTDYRIEKYQNIDMAPAPIIPFDTEEVMKYERNTKTYSSDTFYPKNPFKLSEKIKLRGVDVVTLGITPFQYNPVTKELLVYKDIKFDIELNGGTNHFGENRLRSRWWDPILDDALMNFSALPNIDYAKEKNTRINGEFEYVILTLDDPIFLQYAETIAEFRREQGISTGVVNIADVPGGNDVASIEAWVDDMYANWATPPTAVLILADYGTGANGITSQSYSHPYSGSFITDNKYADIDGDDLPDIVFARITANDESQLETMVTKFLNYESNPPTNPDFYNNPISALGWQTERWFQICSEAIKGYWENELGKQPVAINKIYDGNPSSTWSTATNTATVIDFFGPNGLGYLPELPSDLGGNAYWDSGNSTAVTNAINNGSFMLQHRDHGGETGWGEPAYHNSDIDNLNNTDLTFVMSINCLTGRFDYSSEVFAEKFHRHTSGGNPSGALGIIAASQVSYSFVNDTYVWGAYDNMWPDFMPGQIANPESRMILPAFANVAGKNFLQQSNWPYNTNSKQITHRLFHHHGDAFLNVYSEVPQNLSVNAASEHIFGHNQYDITVDEGAFVAMTYFDTVNQKTVIVAAAESAGGVTSLDMTNCPNVGTNLLLTITKQNYYRYSENVLVISPSGPYITVHEFTINDGNNNEADYEETLNLDITLKNVGTATSESISASLSTSDVNIIAMTNATDVPYSNLAPSATETSSGKFALDIAHDTPDQHNIIFDMEITDAATKAVYNSNISFRVNAPSLEVADLFIDDTATGNADGILDPGETVTITIQTANMGHADVSNVISSLTTSSSDIVINTPTAPIGALAVGETGDFSFSVTAGAGVSPGTLADITNDVTGGTNNQYTAQDIFSVIIGFVPVYCVSEATSTADTMITEVQFGNVVNDTSSSGCVTYSDFTEDESLTDSFEVGTTHDIKFFIGTCNGTYTKAGKVFIDWNYDGDFDDADEMVFESTAQNANWLAEGTFTVPTGIPSGPKFMRIVVSEDETNISPCGTYTYGETEDYKIYVFDSLAIDENELSNVNLYPNPNEGTFTVDLRRLDTSNTIKIELFNINGQLIYQKNTAEALFSINTNETSGVYFLRLTSGGQVINKKVIISNN